MKDFKNLRIKKKLCIIKIYLLVLILIIINLIDYIFVIIIIYSYWNNLVIIKYKKLENLNKIIFFGALILHQYFKFSK